MSVHSCVYMTTTMVHAAVESLFLTRIADSLADDTDISCAEFRLLLESSNSHGQTFPKVCSHRLYHQGHGGALSSGERKLLMYNILADC